MRKEDVMRVGDRVELRSTGAQGKLMSFDYHLCAPICTIILDSGEEVKATLLDVKAVKDQEREAKKRELMKKIKKGGD
jgi:hypothetical protein